MGLEHGQEESRTRTSQRSSHAERPADRDQLSAAHGSVAASPPGLLSLQRRAGNRAVSGAMAGGSIVQRFVGREHKDLGDMTARTIDLGNGVILSWGDIVALAGDEYASLDDLMADTRDDAGKQRLLAAFRDDHIPDPAGTRLPEPSDDQKEARFLAFLRLAAENPEHFNADGGAVERWRRDHTTAIAAALDAGLTGDAAARQLALAREAFAQHFLTDSFSGGHIRTRGRRSSRGIAPRSVPPWSTGSSAGSAPDSSRGSSNRSARRPTCRTSSSGGRSARESDSGSPRRSPAWTGAATP